MIIDWLVSMLVGNGPGDLHGLLGNLFGALPDAGDLGLSNTSGVFAFMSTLNVAVPLDVVGACLGVYLVAVLAVIAVRTVITIWAQIPVIGGHG